ncbi:hypothetical protein TRFO_23213 [Tritrichomonas foetus]|uniref:Uncharacterized protein n=1 Tax=Tritrichomonas foetus TaxID=1144522 RepID=A0A1J4KBM7_9EUKA|nr:hypothetical protein TRFO_23213 [Tritrichomonas foetus]|eukprot:OHT08370.1 hypothetical protein TRFO_23213 [Tritrichomonas foetus]
MAFLTKFLAPEPTESDEEFLTRRLNDFMNGNTQGNVLDDILQYSRQYKRIIGIKAWTFLVESLSSYKRDTENQYKILRILNELVNDESLEANSISGYIVNDEDAFVKIMECLSSNESNIRGITLTLLKNFLRLQISKVQTIFISNSRVQQLVLGLKDDPSDMIRSNFYYVIPSLVKDNSDIQQLIAFQLVDALAERIVNSPDIITVIQSLIEGSPMAMKLFVQTGHMIKLLPSIKTGDKNSISLLTLLFKSSEAAHFRQYIQGDLISTIIDQSISPNNQRSNFLNLLGYIIKGDQELCSSINEKLENVLEIAMNSNDQTEEESVLFCLECYTIKLSMNLAEAICVKMSSKTAEILENYKNTPKPVISLLSIGCSCLISNHDSLTLFYGTNLSSGKCFFTHTIEILAVMSIDMVDLLTNLLKFASAAVWESQNASKYFVSTLSTFQREDKQSSLVFLISLCQRDIDISIRNVACLLVLELLLFKPDDDSFSQLITAIKSHIGINEIISILDSYSKVYIENEEQSQWGEFVAEAYRNVRVNKDGLLNQQVEIKSSSAAIASLQSQLSEATQENKELKESNTTLQADLDKNQEMIEDLEKQIEELSQANFMYENALTQCNTEKDQLEEELENLRSKFGCISNSNNFSGSNSNELEQKYELLQTQFNEMKENLSKEIENLKNENQLLKEKIQSSDAANEYMKENEDLRIQLKRAQQHIQELSQTDEELKQAKAELAKFYIGSNSSTSSFTPNTNTILNNNSSDSQLIEKDQRIQELEKTEKENEKLIAQINQENDEMKANSIALENTNKSLTNEISQLKVAQTQLIEKHNEEIQNLQNMNANTETELIEAMEKNEEYEKIINEKKSKIKQLKNDMNKGISNKDNETLLNQIQTLNEELSQTKEQNNLLLTEKSKSSTKIEELEIANQSLKEMTEQLTSQLNSNNDNNESDSLNEKIQLLENDKIEFENKIIQLNSELKNEIDQNENYISEIESLKKKITSLGDENSEKLSKYEKQIIDLKNNNIQKDELIETMKTQLDEKNSIQEEFGSLEQNRFITDSIDQYKLQISEKESIISSLNDEYERLKTTTATRIDDMQNQINVLLESSNRKPEETEKDKKIFEMVNELRTKQDELKEKEIEIQILQDKVSNLEWLSETVQTGEQNSKEEIQKLLNETEEKQHSLIQKEQQIKQLTDEINSYKQKIEESSNSIASLKNEMETLKDQIKTLKQESESIKQENETLKNVNQNVNVQLETAKKENETLQRQNKDLQASNHMVKDINTYKLTNQFKEYQVMLNDKNSEISSLQNQIKDFNRAKENLEKQISKSQKQIELKNNEINSLKTELDKLNQVNLTKDNIEGSLEKDSLKSTISDLTAKIIDLQKQLSEKEIQIFNFQEELQKASTNNFQKVRLEQQINDKDRKIASLETQIAYNQEISKSKDFQIALLQKQIDESQNNERNAQTQRQKDQINKDLLISQLQNEVTDLKTQNRLLEEQKNQILKQQKHLIQSDASNDEQLIHMETKMHSLEIENERLKKENSKLTVIKNESLNRETQMQSLIKEMENKDRLIDELKKSQIELAKKCKGKIKNYKTKINSFESQRSEEIGAKNSEIRNLSSKVIELQSRIDVGNDVTPEISELSFMLNNSNNPYDFSFSFNDDSIHNSIGNMSNIEALRNAKNRVSYLLQDYHTLRSKSELQEQELQQSRIQQQRQNEKIQNLKKRLAKEILRNQKTQQSELIRLNTVDDDRMTVQRLKDDLNKAHKELNALQVKHQSALRLIGQLWTQNQSIVKKQPTDL